jgi:hypothetical protein
MLNVRSTLSRWFPNVQTAHATLAEVFRVLAAAACAAAWAAVAVVSAPHAGADRIAAMVAGSLALANIVFIVFRVRGRKSGWLGLVVGALNVLGAIAVLLMTLVIRTAMGLS